MNSVDTRSVLAFATAALVVSFSLGTAARAEHSHADHAGSGSATHHQATARPERRLAGGIVAYGATLALPKNTPIQELQADPDRFAGVNVRVAGTVTDVCPMAGCWMKIADDSGREITLKVRDGVMVFPMTAKGQRAIAEGTVRKIELDVAQARKYLAHLAEEKGESFDPGSVKGPMTIVQVDGRGALVRPQ